MDYNGVPSPRDQGDTGVTAENIGLTSEELILLSKCLHSRVCMRIFKVLLRFKTLNISAISRKAGCTNARSLSHLSNLTRLGIVHEKFYTRIHMFNLKRSPLTVLLEDAFAFLEAEKTS